jgi:hypothetical protein
MKGQALITADLVGKAIQTGLYIAFLLYLGKLEQTGCECALNWRRQFIIAFIVVTLVWTLATVVMTPFKNVYLAVLLTAFRLAFIVIAIQYVNKLKKDKCECSEHLTRDILYYYAWIAVILTAIALFSVVAALTVAYTR